MSDMTDDARLRAIVKAFRDCDEETLLNDVADQFRYETGRDACRSLVARACGVPVPVPSPAYESYLPVHPLD